MRLLVFAVAIMVAASACGGDVMRIGIHDKPPFARKTSEGAWEGIGVELWKSIALQTGLKFEFVEMPYEEIIPAIADGRLQAAVGEFTITAASEKLVHFTQPYIQSSTGVAIRHGSWHPDWLVIARDFFNWTLLEVLALIFAGLLIVSALIWVFERHHQVGHFRGGLSGLGSALWFSLATMTTVGYGDKTPATFWGRLISMVWMLAGVLLVAGLTASVAASVSAARMNEMIARPSDLYRTSCGTLSGSVAEQYLRHRGIASRGFETIEAALEALSEGKIQAVVANKISLQYLALTLPDKSPPIRFAVSNLSFNEIFVGIPVQPDLPEFDDINLALLSTTSSPEWEKTVRRWLGQ